MADWPALEIVFPAAGATDSPAALPLHDRVLADLDGLDILAISEQARDTWQVFFRTEADRAAAMALLHAIPGPGAISVRPIEVDDGDWARRSQASLRAVRAGRIVVAPPWDAGPTDDEPGLITVVIEPAMGFGSGHHATTRLSLEALQRIDVRGRRVLDVGTGSGVLALASARLGAADALGVDVDPDALANAQGNAALNGSPSRAAFRQADFRSDRSLVGDIVVANLTGGLLTAGAQDLTRAVAPGGTLIISGVTVEERDGVYATFARDFRLDWSVEAEGWCCALLKKTTVE